MILGGRQFDIYSRISVFLKERYIPAINSSPSVCLVFTIVLNYLLCVSWYNFVGWSHLIGENTQLFPNTRNRKKALLVEKHPTQNALP